MQKVKCNFIKCEELKTIFEARAIPYGLRAFRVLKEDNSPRNYFRFSSIPRIKREWNKIVQILNLNINESVNLGEFKKISREAIFEYK